MKAKFLGIALVAVTAGWLLREGPAPEAIIGQWQEGGNRLEFRPDGSWYASAPGKPFPVWGTYALEGNTLLMRYGNPPMPVLERYHHILLSGDELAIEHYVGEHRFVFQRVVE